MQIYGPNEIFPFSSSVSSSYLLCFVFPGDGRSKQRGFGQILGRFNPFSPLPQCLLKALSYVRSGNANLPKFLSQNYAKIRCFLFWCLRFNELLRRFETSQFWGLVNEHRFQLIIVGPLCKQALKIYEPKVQNSTYSHPRRFLATHAGMPNTERFLDFRWLWVLFWMVFGTPLNILSGWGRAVLS